MTKRGWKLLKVGGQKNCSKSVEPVNAPHR